MHTNIENKTKTMCTAKYAKVIFTLIIMTEKNERLRNDLDEITSKCCCLRYYTCYLTIYLRDKFTSVRLILKRFLLL